MNRQHRRACNCKCCVRHEKGLFMIVMGLASWVLGAVIYATEFNPLLYIEPEEVVILERAPTHTYETNN